ncbi:MAG: leucine-rich repeat domain-containing protein [Spirochaetaceae bacterium]|nr:leucine-rich repeat domain-containing protein [Spirochaetaceae bacterium]
MKKFFVAGVFFSVCVSLFAQTTRWEDYRVDITKDVTGAEQRAVIRDYTGRGNAITIQPTREGVRVEIGENALKGKGLVSVDIRGIRNIGQGAFANNSIEKLTISENVNLGSQSFDNNFAAYYSAKGKAEGTYTYDPIRRRWFTDEDRRGIAEQEAAADARRKAEQEKAAADARRRAEEERRRRADEERRRAEQARRPGPPPSYDNDAVEGCLLGGIYMNVGYYDYISFGLALQAGLAFNPGGDFELDVLGQVEVGGIAMIYVGLWGASAIGELYFGGDWGIGFGLGFTDSGLIAARIDDNKSALGYWRGAILIRDSSYSDGYKVSIYADYFRNSQWRFGFSYLFPLGG